MPLTVLQTLPALEVGGVERGTVEIARELARRGHRSLVISSGGALTAGLVDAGTRHYAWPIGKKSPFTLLLARKLRRFLIEEKVDVLHARSRLPAWVSYLAWKNMPLGSRPAFITTIHGPYSVNPYSEIMTRGEQIIAISGFIRAYVVDNYPEVDPGKITVIPRGVDHRHFPNGFTPAEYWLAQWRTCYPQLRDKALITLPGRITRWKGHEDFIRIISVLKQEGLNIHGLIAGGARQNRRRFHQELKQTVSTSGLDSDITFLGHRDDLREVLSVSDVVLSLAKAPEAFGRTVLEALSLGRPVIAYGHGGAAEVLNELQPDGLITPGGVAEAIDKIKDFLNGPPKIAPNRLFTLENMLNKTLTLYEQARSRN